MTPPLPIPHQISKAVQSGDVEEFSRLLREHPEEIWEKRGEKGRTRWLFSATSTGQLPIIQLLVAAGADINFPKAAVSTFAPEGVIDTAAGEGHLEVVRWLLDRGAQLNHEVDGQVRCFALVGAAGGGHLEVVKLLVERGAAINSMWAKMTPLDHALTYGEVEVAAYLRSVGGKTADELDKKG